MSDEDIQLNSRRAIYQEIADSPGTHFRALLDTLSYAPRLHSIAVLAGLIAGGLYFDTAALILVFITLGNYLEARSKGQAGEALRKLLEMEAETATVVDENGNEEEIPLEAVEVGDRMKVRPGEKIPTDGIDPAPAAETMERLENEGKTAMLVARVPAGATEGELIGVVADADTIKESATGAVSQLHERSIDVMIITGDNERTARAVAKQVGIDPEDVHAEVLPEDKSAAIKAIQDEGRKAMMVGDGVNDAPALAVAHVGTATGSGTDVAIETADVTLMRDDPVDVVKAIRISDATLQKIKQNLVWALGYNTAMIPLASLGLLQPVLAAGAMAFSSVSVLSNSLLFRRYTPDHDYELFGRLR